MLTFTFGFIVGGLLVGLVAINNHLKALELRARLMKAYDGNFEPAITGAWNRLVAWVKGWI